MKHASHPHELHISSDDETSKTKTNTWFGCITPNKPNKNKNHTCFGCNLPLFGTHYSCSTCNFHLHEFCFDLPQSAHFDSHPKHTLGLLYPPYCQGACDACSGSCNGFTYNCTFCNYNIHANCASLLHLETKDDHDMYVKMFLGHKVSEMKCLRSQLGNAMMSGRTNGGVEELAYMRKMEMEAELQRRRHNMHMQQLKQMSDSINFMGQIGTSNYTYRYF